VIWEVASITVKAGMEQEFEAGVAKAAPLFRRARGCRSMKLQKSIENPNGYRLVVGWDTVEDHMVQFRNSDDFGEWRKLVSNCFDSAPVVEHTSDVFIGFSD
jgi:heme-degrading monooxygenase HmoA